MVRKVMYVTPRQTQNGLNWATIGQNAEKATKIFENKNDAIDLAKQIAKNAEIGQIKVQNTYGKFQYENTYRNDPVKYKG